MPETSGHNPDIIVPTIDGLNQGITEVAQSIRVFSESQVDTWRYLPYLALQADGRRGYSSFNKHLYTHGMLSLGLSSENLYGTFIDCDSGAVLRQNCRVELDRLASDQQVLEAWLPNGSMFDAAQWRTWFRRAAEAPHRVSAQTTETQARQWRLNTAKHIGLSAVFYRTELISAQR